MAISDLHVVHPENRRIVEELRPVSDRDWLIVAGDVGEMSQDIAWALETLSRNFARVIWAPGNHELWTPRDDPLELRGLARYEHLVALCRSLGVVTPEDPYPVWEGPGGPVVVAPLFVLYDYTFRTDPSHTRRQALEQAYENGVVCTDEFLLHPDPYPSRQAWCAARLEQTEARLAAQGSDLPLVLVNHFPLTREPTDILHYPDFALWCGSERTADWLTRFPVEAVVYGHLHIPRTTWYRGIRCEEVSVGYPREWRRPGHPRTVPPRRILPYERS
ncbi:metallophosphoesterase [Streptomyces sulfonofaciens]|uniref:Metallophosphoesterase n=1 Tax=Streptomyces sulfonofaciens TaxID=68272 RepID=A0A919GIS4_9ACTN|nr:metallophosphoesterase [Streptomyces sulfonofaciens]GHH84869.1 metallophosphoesterase [Streptomyces sulfonofaciens]